LAVAPAAARPRPGGGRLFIIVGLLLALVAFGAVFLLGSLGGGGAIGGPSNVVVVAKQQIPLRHQITDADLTTAKISLSGDATLSNTYTATKDVLNLISEINISKGAVITSDMLAKDINLVQAGAAPAYLPLASGFVALTVPTSEQQGVAGHISLGDYITVIATTNVQIFATGTSGSPAVQGTVSKTVFTNVHVIGLGPASNGVQSASSQTSSTTQQTTTGVTSSLTIEMTQCDAEYMTWFLANTQLRYTLESFHDYLTQPPSQPDPACPGVINAGGVGPKQVDAKFHFTTLLTGK
jgi:Flp pilus assembly protein CpaB